MGLIKTLDFKGFQPEYWFIKEIRPDFLLQRTTVVMSLYKDAIIRAADKAGSNFNNMIDNSNYSPEIYLVTIDGVALTYEEMYTAIKANQQNTFFADAVDELTI